MANKNGVEREKKQSARRYRFRLRIISSVIILGLAGIWVSYYTHLTRERAGWDTLFRHTIVRQVQSLAELIRIAHQEDIVELKARANNINARLIQNENILAENSRYAGTVPGVSIENMSSDAFLRVGTALEEYREAINFSEQFYVNDDLYGVSPRFIYIVDNGIRGETTTLTEEGRNTHTARVLADSFRFVERDGQGLWLGLYIRGSEAEVAYDRIAQGNIIAGPLLRSSVEHFAGAPIYDRDGLEVIATVILEYDITAALVALRQSRFTDLWFHFGITAAYIIMVLLTSLFLFSPLRRLLHSAFRIQRNDFNSKAFLRSGDELALIGDSMDKITERLDSAVYDIKSIANIQNSLFPRVYLEFLDKESVGELEVGEYVDRYVTIMSIQSSCPHILERQHSSSADTIELVNDIIQYIGSVLDNDSGFIEKFTVDELLLFFTRNPDIAMETAMNLQYNAVQWNEERVRHDKPSVSFNIALHRGTVSFSIIGDDQFIKPYAISDAIETTMGLSHVAKQIGSPVMVTETLSRNLVKSLNYQFRYLGSMLFGMKQSVQVMEEIDVYPAQLKRIIAATKIDFEEAVKSFERRYINKARTIFDALAEQSPDDKVVESFRAYIEKQYVTNKK